MSSRLKYTKEALEKAVADNHSMASVMRQVGAPITGSSYRSITNRVHKYGLDTNHFTGQGWSKGVASKTRLTPEQVFVLNDPSIGRHRTQHVKRALLETGTPYECGSCGISEWRNAEITLELDHRDGNWSNNKRENVWLLCPNCHSQQPTSRPRRQKEKPH